MSSFGENLRRERELRGVDLREMADATKISIRFLRALEDGRIEVLPGGIFPRAFVRQYAKYLGLDADRLVSDFMYAHGGAAAAAAAVVRGTKPEVRVDQGMPRAVVLAGIVAVVLVLIGWRMWAPGGEDQPPAIASTVPPPSFANDRVFPPPSTTAAQPATSGITVVLVARAACWVGARVDGQDVLNRVLADGEAQRLQAQREVVLSVGNAGRMALTINGSAVPPLGRDGDARKNVVINAQTLPGLLAGAPPAAATPAASPRPRPRPPSPQPSPEESALPTLPVAPTAPPLAPPVPAPSPLPRF